MLKLPAGEATEVYALMSLYAHVWHGTEPHDIFMEKLRAEIKLLREAAVSLGIHDEQLDPEETSETFEECIAIQLQCLRHDFQERGRWPFNMIGTLAERNMYDLLTSIWIWRKDLVPLCRKMLDARHEASLQNTGRY